MSAAVNRQGAAADLANARMQGLGGAVQGLRSNIETALLQLALPALPWVTGLVLQVSTMVPVVIGWLGQMGTGIGTLLSQNQPGLDLLVQTFGTYLVTAFNTFGPLAVALFSGLGLVIQMALPYAISLATAVGELMVTAFNAAKPVIDLVVGALQFLAPIMGVTLVAQMTLLQGVIQAFTLLLKGDFSGAWAIFQGAAKTAFNLLKVGWDALWTAIDAVTGGASLCPEDWK
jgi:phage-related protein